MMNYNHLHYFYVTAKLGGVSNAAQFLHISQPALSAQLKIFESTIGHKLFEKKGRRLQLTTDGETAYAFCRKIFDIASELAEALKTPNDHLNRRIKIGISDQVERPFIADLLSPLIREQKKGTEKTFFVSSAPSEALLQQLRSEEIDLVLTNKPIYAEDVLELISASLPVNLLVSSKLLKEQKLKNYPNNSAAEFIRWAPWGLVIPSYKIKLRHETDLFFQRIKVQKKVAFESDIMSVVGRAITDGAGIGFLPVAYAYEEIKSGAVVSLGPKSGYWKHKLYLLGRRNAVHDVSLNEVKDSLKRLEKLI